MALVFVDRDGGNVVATYANEQFGGQESIDSFDIDVQNFLASQIISPADAAQVQIEGLLIQAFIKYLGIKFGDAAATVQGDIEGEL